MSPTVTDIKAQGEGFAEPWVKIGDIFRSLEASNNDVGLFVPFRDGYALSVFPRVPLEDSLHPRL